MISSKWSDPNTSNSEVVSSKNFPFEDLEDLAQQINESVHAARHDLRSPLFVIRSYAEILIRSKDSKNCITKLERIKQASHKMEQLIDAFAHLTDIQTLNITDLDFQNVEDALIKVRFKLMNEIEQLKPEFKINIEKTPSIWFSYSYLVEILKALIENALIHNQDQPNLCIEVSTEIVPQYIKIEVKDNGAGISDMESQEKLFKPFYRHSVIADRPGIGLSIVKTILDRTKGKIEIETSAGKGTKCTVYLRKMENSTNALDASNA